MRRIVYVSGTRADYGLMRVTLRTLAADRACDLRLIVTGMHLDERFGATVREIERDGLPIMHRIPSEFDSSEGYMALAIADTIKGCVQAFEKERPDLVLLLGDRGEMLASAIAAIHLNIPIAHIHGGERSGTIDEPVRHAISKLSHIHLTSTTGAADRLRRMGEKPEHVFPVGAPGLTQLEVKPSFTRNRLCEKVGLSVNDTIALLVFHPVVQEANDGPRQLSAVLGALSRAGCKTIALKPNGDFGRNKLDSLLSLASDAGHCRVYTHLDRDEFVGWMACADVMLGNSSAGIIEAGTFGTPVINIGSRQNLRERNQNVFDVTAEEDKVLTAIREALRRGRLKPSNIYGDGKAAARICKILTSVKLDQVILKKANTY